LWLEPEERFTVRFLDVNEKQKLQLAKRIKVCAPIRSIKKSTGPTPEDIYQTLVEINPIIFSESLARNWRPNSRYAHQSFGKQHVKAIEGWEFKALCTAIYKTLCLRRTLTKDEVGRIAQLTSCNYEKIESILDQFFSNQPIERPRARPEELGIEEIRRSRENINNREIPEEIRDNSEPNEESNNEEDIVDMLGRTRRGTINNGYNALLNTFTDEYMPQQITTNNEQARYQTIPEPAIISSLNLENAPNTNAFYTTWPRYTNPTVGGTGGGRENRTLTAIQNNLTIRDN